MKQLIKQLFCEHYYRDFKGIQNWESIYQKTAIDFSLCEKCGKARNISIKVTKTPDSLKIITIKRINHEKI